jgi:hypothetical protein
VTGRGVGPQILITPTRLDFGEVQVGATSPEQRMTVTNVGPSPVVMSGAGGALQPPFYNPQDCQGKTLNPGESCHHYVTFRPTATGPVTGSTNGTWSGQSYTFAVTGIGLGDTEGPVTSSVLASPNPVQVGTGLTLAAQVDDGATGGSTILSAEYSLDSGPWMPMTASDGAFDEVMEEVSANLTAPVLAGVYSLCVRGTDASSNSGASECMLLAVYDPGAGFVTGGGWIASPAGAFTAEPSLTGKATFGFVSRYKKGASTPEGNTEFRFQAAGLNFHSSAYDYLVISQGGTNAQFKGSGTINGMAAPDGSPFKFMTWATDGSPDTFRIRIWWEFSGQEQTVYDNGFGHPLGGGSIVIHTK